MKVIDVAHAHRIWNKYCMLVWLLATKCKPLLKLGMKERRTLDSYHTWKFVHRPSVNKGSNMNYLSDRTITQSTGMHIRSCTNSLLHSTNNVYSFALRMLLPIKDQPSRPPLNHLNSLQVCLKSVGSKTGTAYTSWGQAMVL